MITLRQELPKEKGIYFWSRSPIERVHVLVVFYSDLTGKYVATVDNRRVAVADLGGYWCAYNQGLFEFERTENKRTYNKDELADERT